MFICHLSLKTEGTEEEGFEPPGQFPAQRFSRPPPSTTRPFLRSTEYQINVYEITPSKNTSPICSWRYDDGKVRSPTMKRAASATFLLFYAAITVVAISEHTAAYASTLASNSPLQTRTFRAASPHSPQVRIPQEPFAGLQIKSAFTLSEYRTTSVRPASIRFEVDSKRFTPSRAPPAVL
jgi:hypothetical protein